MTIKSLNDFLAGRAPDFVQTWPLIALSGENVTIDFYNWLYRNLAVIRSRVIQSTNILHQEPDEREIFIQIFKVLIDFICRWLNHKITPIFVRDGEPLEEKKDVWNKRRQEKQQAKEEITLIRQSLDSLDPLERNKQYHLVDRLRKLYNKSMSLGKEFIDELENFIAMLGIPIVQAKNDAEQLCCMLCIDGVAKAVFSNDTDNLVYGCPIVITGFEQSTYDEKTKERTDYCKVSLFSEAIKGLGCDHKFFIDLCIMAGCDYNVNIKGVGIVNSYKYLLQCQSIDNLPDHLDKTCLRHERCREIFSYQTSSDIIVSGSLTIKPLQRDNNLREFLAQYNLSHYIDRFVPLYHNQCSAPKKKLVLKLGN